MRDRFSRWKMTPFWESSKLTFFWDWFIQRITPALQLVYAFLVRARSFFRSFYAIFFSIWFAFSCFFCSRLFQEVFGRSRCLEICVAQVLFVKSFSWTVAAIVLEKSCFRAREVTARAKFWYRPYHFVQLRVLERSRPQLSKYRSKVSILSSLVLIFRFAAEETIFWLLRV